MVWMTEYKCFNNLKNFPNPSPSNKEVGRRIKGNMLRKVFHFTLGKSMNDKQIFLLGA